MPIRHVEALDELNSKETHALGPLLVEVSAALRAVTGCVKTYVLLLAEAEDFSHVHFRAVPRDPLLPEERRGTAIYSYLKEEPLTDDVQEDLAPAAPRTRLRHHRGRPRDRDVHVLTRGPREGCLRKARYVGW